VHRDLKPANIMVSKQGLKLLDFGLAKQTGAVKSDTTVTAGLTGAGAILGTLQYMSPEQLQGKAVDARSDLFAFGCVLYEMLTGKRAFEGENPASVIAAVLEREPAPLQISPPLDRVIARCVAKDPDQRFQTASDLKVALKWAIEQTPMAVPATRRWMAATAALAVCTAGLAIALWAPWRKPAPEPPNYTFTIEPAEGDAASGPFSLSRDGTMIQVRAFDSHGQGLMMFRRLDSFEWRRVPISEITGRTCWSPDGKEIAYTTRSKVQKMDIASGAVQTLADYTTGGPPFVGWSRTGMIVFSRRGGLWKIPASGGEPAQLTTIDENREEIWHHIADFLPDGRHFLYLAGSRQQAKSGIYLGSIDAPPANNRKFVLSSSTGVLYAPGPHGTLYLLFEREGALMAQRFDTSTDQTTGEPFMVLPKIQVAGSFPAISVSETGVIGYATDSGSSMYTQLAWLSRKGERISDVAPPGRYLSYSLSPDGNRVALHRVERDDSNVWILDLSRNRFTRLTLDQGASPVWSSDGREVAYIKQRAGQTVYRKPVDGAAEEQAMGGPLSSLTDWTLNGQILGHRMLGVLGVLADGRVSSVLPASEASVGWSHLSPDGKWIVYSSDESKRQSEIYVQSYPLKGAKFQVSTGGGVQPRWRADGQELYYVAIDGKLMAVPVKTGANFEFGNPVALFQPPVPQGPGSSGYGVSPDGQRFLFRTMPAGYRASAITIMTNWMAAVKH
jgi:Tol biopolymer transport system component